MTRIVTHAADLALLKAHKELPTLATLAVKVAVVVTQWHMHWRTRRTLRGLTAHELQDVGLTPAEARREANKRFYQR